MNDAFWEGFEKEAGRAAGAKKVVQAVEKTWGDHATDVGAYAKKKLTQGYEKGKDLYGKAKTEVMVHPKGSAIAAGAGAAAGAAGYAATQRKQPNPYGY